MKNVLPALTAFVVLALLTAGCGKEEQAEFDRDAILKYLDDNSLTATEHDSGIFYIIETPGTGGSPSLNSTITFKYKGYYLDGVVFDQTTGNNTATYPLSNLIQGWQIAIPLLQKGGKGKFFIPSALGYGPNPPFGVRANAVLVFEIELVDF
ncbi:MAG: FKBP-type peptidyl-prolyl cis-trans isomerase [Saprospiraceae bacterium]|nr:FKBP-type peptidyl-prolyl cis-trans isomerase [Saprospiraceae bacterium]